MPRHPHFQAYLALAAVCFFWGTTYLGIRIAIESIEPAVLMCLRYAISGIILLAVAYFSKAHLPSGRELWYTALFGVIIIGGGTGCLVFAEQWVPSGLAAVFITLSPFWMIGIDALIPGGERLHGPTIVAMLVGLAGTTLLVAPEIIREGFGGPLVRGFILLQLGCAAWCLGSILQRRHQTTAHPVVTGAVQQLATGIAFAVPALFSSRIRPLGAAAVSARWLISSSSVPSSATALTSLRWNGCPFRWSASTTTSTRSSRFSWAGSFFASTSDCRKFIAMLIIFFGVALVKRYSRPPSPKPARVSVAS